MNAAAWLGAMLYAAGGLRLFSTGSVGFSVTLLLWPLAPTVGMVCVVLLAHQVWHGGFRVAAVGVALLVLITAVSLLSILISDSSTAGLGFITLPLIEAAVVVFVGLFTMGCASLPSAP